MQAMQGQKEDLFKYDYGRPISRLIEKEGSIYNIALNLFSEFCTGKYENYLDNSQVEKFIGWLEQNKGHLQKNIENIIKNKLIEGDLRTEEQVYYALGFMVGGQYVLGKYTNYDKEVDGRGVKLWAKGGGAQWIGRRMEINMGISQGVIDLGKKPDAREAFAGFLRGLNTGIHEYAHGLRHFSGMDKNFLSELGVSLVCRDLTLPIHYKDMKSVLDGVRDPIRFVEQIREGKVELSYADVINQESISFMVTPWIGEYLQNKGEGMREFAIGCLSEGGAGSMALNQVYWKDEVFNPERYLKFIPDKNVKKVLESVFDNFLKEHWKTPHEFFEKLFDALDEGFGCRPSTK